MATPKRIAVLITTHQRAEMLLTLLKQINEQGKDFNLTLIIAIDGRQPGYDEVFLFLDQNFPDQHYLLIPPKHGGKPGYWELTSMLYNEALKMHKWFDHNFDYFIQVPDDINIAENFFFQAIEQFEAITDTRNACLNLINDGRFQPGWTHIKHKRVTFGRFTYILSGWVDMCFIAKARYFELLNWRINPVNTSWATNPKRSSGVGMQISKRLVKLGMNLYMVQHALVTHGTHKSAMHPDLRKIVPLTCSFQHEKVIAGMASMAGREKSLKQAVQSLINQVDELHITLNSYTSIPDFLQHEKIKVTSDPANSRGDAAKFSILGKEGYLFTVDDDLIYPADYVEKMIRSIEKYNRKAIITLHGRTFRSVPVKSYYHCDARVIRCLDAHLADEYIQVPGTGVSAFHSSTIPVRQSDFHVSNMSDIWLGVAAQLHTVPVVAMAHKRGWITESLNYDVLKSIHARMHSRDQFQALVVNSINWILYDKLD